MRTCRIEVMDAIEACTTVTQIQLDGTRSLFNFLPPTEQEKLPAIATRKPCPGPFHRQPPCLPIRRRVAKGNGPMRQMSQWALHVGSLFPRDTFLFKSNESNISSTAGSKSGREDYRTVAKPLRSGVLSITSWSTVEWHC